MIKMFSCGGCRISHQNLGLGFCSARILQLSSFMVQPPSFSSASAIVNNNSNHRFQSLFVSSSSLQSKSPGDIPILPDFFSQREDEREHPSEILSSVAGGIVALGKFDALHIGHRELAIQASKVGTPYLLSLVGMAEVLGWEPRPPIVAQCDRTRVLSSWAPYCGNVAPREFQLQFMGVRHLTPRQFVEKLAKELGVCGVVAGDNYQFGYKAAGDASELLRLCDEFGVGAYIIKSVMDRHQDARNMNRYDLKERGQVSSTRVRHALAEGDMKYVSELLGRQHRLLLVVKDWESLTSTSSKHRVSAPKSSLLNLPPKDGFYDNCSLLFGKQNPVTCRISIDTTHIHLEADWVDFGDYDYSKTFQVLGIEFGELRLDFA
ncbi:FAD synthetase 2, chloroplastic-like [Durio zibethinus]|uniref:FAD synthase n=1 Tax=Durio zibethinus TaxID=66656 RepID=A0A6P6AGH0_DURZI|nr:FAD synthetase 2, chloroplastic-like [Durio zibethinus]XP_022763895.1 FAD synthetase 2, chloroplastic-like [Durio zibethinus]XP_022763896.1 FAD synthetase 2, chloroplastic-like [Durio zibethinus]XP_022763897.1 FAD synthetase 2, chloroplastic-like [Durio zibethinus]XP_022763898.1 FAD synthetase 2, chloroplastic-like [Durio zibethinus]XP_022763899.1 FAD synthetase 2, chloroplastic-like [Durio zibethinus]